jgi:hypothetical protein
MALAWTVILGATLAASAWDRRRTRSGKWDLVIDDLGHWLELPLTCGRKTRLRVPAADIREVQVLASCRVVGGTPRTLYAPCLCLGPPGAEPTCERLVEWNDGEKAAEFVAWLQGRLLPAAAPSSSEDYKHPGLL